MDDACLKKIAYIANACIKFWLLHFKTATTVIIPKPNKDSYSIPKSFQPIVLLNITEKLKEKVISNCLQFYMTSNSFFDLNQLSGIKQQFTICKGTSRVMLSKF